MFWTGQLNWYSDSTRAERSGIKSRRGGGARISAPLRTGPAAQTASYTMGTSSFPDVQQPGHGVNHPHPI
jgi:hypothetical protein